MRKVIACGMCLFVLFMSGTAYGLAQEQIGPDKPDRPTTSRSRAGPRESWRFPGISSRVYSIWVNGNENFYFKATPAEVNEILTSFSKARMRDHEVVIAAERGKAKPINGAPIDYNVHLQIVAGIAMAMARGGESNLPLEPRLTICAGADRSLVEKIAWPRNVTITNETAGLSLPSGRARPQRDAYYAKC